MSPFICLTCDKDCDSSDGTQSGRSSCCNSPLDYDHWEQEDREKKFKAKRSSDPTINTEKKAKTSPFRGVCKFQNRWRAVVTVKSKNYLLGDYDEDTTAARVVDNAKFYLSRAGFIAPNPFLNFPAEYRDPETRPFMYSKTSRLVSRFDAGRAIQDSAAEDARQRHGAKNASRVADGLPPLPFSTHRPSVGVHLSQDS